MWPLLALKTGETSGLSAACLKWTGLNLLQLCMQLCMQLILVIRSFAAPRACEPYHCSNRHPCLLLMTMPIADVSWAPTGLPTTHWFQLRCVFKTPILVPGPGCTLVGHLRLVAHRRVGLLTMNCTSISTVLRFLSTVLRFISIILRFLQHCNALS